MAGFTRHQAITAPGGQRGTGRDWDETELGQDEMRWSWDDMELGRVG